MITREQQKDLLKMLSDSKYTFRIQRENNGCIITINNSCYILDALSEQNGVKSETQKEEGNGGKHKRKITKVQWIFNNYEKMWEFLLKEKECVIE